VLVAAADAVEEALSTDKTVVETLSADETVVWRTGLQGPAVARLAKAKPARVMNGSIPRY
jgi:hypothetical protein